MRVQKFSTIYDRFLGLFLSENRDFAGLSYAAQYDRFVRTWYGLADFYALHLTKAGHEAQDLFASFRELQTTWAAENGVRFSEESWMIDIMVAQVQSFQPDVIYLQDLYLFDRPVRQRLREACKQEPLVVGWRSSVTTDFSAFNDLDLVLTGVPSFVDQLRAAGANAEFMALGFEETILQTIAPPETRQRDAVFTGTIGSRNSMHSQRYRLIEELMEDSPLEIWADESTQAGKPAFQKFVDQFSYNANQTLNRAGVPATWRGRVPGLRRAVGWEYSPGLPAITERFPDRCHAPVFGRKYFELLGSAKIALNSHIDCAGEYAANMRLFEATGMGACLLTDWKRNLDDFFEPDVDVVCYRSAEECKEKIKYLLDNDSVREDIARRGQQRTLSQHSYANRVQQFLGLMEQHFSMS